MTAPSIKKRVWRRGERREAGRDAGRNGVRAQPLPARATDPKDTAQSPTPSWDSFTLAGAPALREIFEKVGISDDLGLSQNSELLLHFF